MFQYPFFWGRIEYVHAGEKRVAHVVALIEEMNSGNTVVSLFRFAEETDACRFATGYNDSCDGLLETVTKSFYLYVDDHNSLDSYWRSELAQAITDCAHACQCIIDHVVYSLVLDYGEPEVTIAPTSQGVRRLVDNW